MIAYLTTFTPKMPNKNSYQLFLGMDVNNYQIKVAKIQKGESTPLDGIGWLARQML